MTPPNLYDFLRRILRDSEGLPGCVNFTAEEREWLQNFLTEPQAEIHFKGHQTHELDDQGQRKMDIHLAVGGHGQDIFVLLGTAAQLNPNFRQIVLGVADFITSNIPFCPICGGAPHAGKMPTTDEGLGIRRQKCFIKIKNLNLWTLHLKTALN